MSAKILIIEDDPVLLRGLVDNFVQRGYSVSTAQDGALGLATALGESPDLIILDVMLPRMSGFEVCRQLRQRKVTAAVIMLTAKSQENDVVQGLELGADDYVTKPFSIRELLARAEAILRRQGGTEQPSYHFGDFELDLVAHELRLGGQAIPLTRKEFQLLEFFLKRPGCALTRREIMNHVWGRSVIVTSRSVDRCVTTLRAKIEPDPHQPQYIVTVRDLGYRFELPSLSSPASE